MADSQLEKAIWIVFFDYDYVKKRDFCFIIAHIYVLVD